MKAGPLFAAPVDVFKPLEDRICPLLFNLREEKPDEKKQDWILMLKIGTYYIKKYVYVSTFQIVLHNFFLAAKLYWISRFSL